MNRTTFYFLLGLAFLFAAIHVVEAVLYDVCQSDQIKVSAAKAQVMRANEIHNRDLLLLKRLVAESQADPQIASFLKKHSIQVVATPLRRANAFTPPPANP